jgi:DNA repair exonuclease SbcCD ATPase subunit
MVEIGNKSQIRVHWKVSPYDFSNEKMKEVRAKFSKKYNIPREKIKVIPEFVLETANNKSYLDNEVISNIQNPLFQQDLFKEYLSINNVQDYDFEFLKNIDAQINSNIDYDVYDKYKRYSIKWIKWDNFLSYGENNYFDFTQLNGLVLLSGEPANQSGKTTFAIDLLHFLLFGKTDKAATLDKIFNKHLQEATEVNVEGCLVIDGEEYVIKRRLTRPSLSKRTSKSKASQKVEYYKIVGGVEEELAEYVEDNKAENSIQTNKIIKESIGNESDFDMIICATSANLDDLIEKKDTERGKLLSRWIGLLPLEQKDILAREMYNSSIKPFLISNQYDTTKLQQENEALEFLNKNLQDEINKYSEENNSLERELSFLEESRNQLLASKTPIDSTLLKVDITTLNNEMNKLKSEGSAKSAELESLVEELAKVGDVEFSIDEYDALSKQSIDLNIQIQLQRKEYEKNKKLIDDLAKSEYCPTCGKKYDNVDNSSKIAELNSIQEKIVIDAKAKQQEKSELDKKIDLLKSNREKYDIRTKTEIKKSVVELKLSQLRNEYKDKRNLLNEYNKNNEAIDRNNNIDINIRNIEVSIKNKRNTKELNLSLIEKNKNSIAYNKKEIETRVNLIKKINEENKVIRHWKIYLDMVGKNGISKMVLRKTLPIINANITRLLSDICDFNVEVAINEKNDVNFFLIKDGVKSDLSSGSGFEKTASALALRAVLGNMSTLPKINYLILDEVLGRIAKENFDNMRTLFEKILENYDAIIQISHLNEIKDWHEKHIVVSKENNISKIHLL